MLFASRSAIAGRKREKEEWTDVVDRGGHDGRRWRWWLRRKEEARERLAVSTYERKRVRPSLAFLTRGGEPDLISPSRHLVPPASPYIVGAR